METKATAPNDAQTKREYVMEHGPALEAALGRAVNAAAAARPNSPVRFISE